MFCETCGTVLTPNGLCINCDKKQQIKDVNTETQIELDILDDEKHEKRPTLLSNM
ncbi:MAG: hypothetical protein ACFFC6_05375 [Promethearchaeota archaeon]